MPVAGAMRGLQQKRDASRGDLSRKHSLLQGRANGHPYAVTLSFSDFATGGCLVRGPLRPGIIPGTDAAPPVSEGWRFLGQLRRVWPDLTDAHSGACLPSMPLSPTAHNAER